MAQGRIDAALAEAVLEPPGAHRSCAQAIVQHGAGQKEESDRSLDRLMKEEGASYQVAMAHAARGEADAAFQALERADVEQDAGLSLVKSDRFLRALRDDPRWPTFLKKLGFEE